MAKNRIDQGILCSLLETFDLAVLGRPPGDRQAAFELLGPAPAWFGEVFGSSEVLCERSAFLEDFVEGAAGDCWEGGGDPVQSGMWEEQGAGDSSRVFEATALRESGKEVLVIALADDRHQRERMFTQQAHERALHGRRLARERERKEILLEFIVHNLSSPLTTILMNIQHVGRQLDRQDLCEALRRAEVQAERQRELIHAVAHAFRSDLASFEPALLAGGGGVEIIPLAAEMIQAYRAMAEQKNTTMELDAMFGAGGKLEVVAEQSHLARIFDNLLEHAVCSSPGGGRIVVRIKPHEGRVRTMVEVGGAVDSDAIGEAALDPFDPEAETAAPDGAAEGGEGGEGEAGLGLYFCKMAVELWGGTIGVEPLPKGGNRFWFELKQHVGEGSGAGRPMGTR